MAILLSLAILIGSIVSSEAQIGLASVFNGGRTARGDYLHGHEMAVAHRTLALGTKINIKNLSNGLQTTAIIRDRGPFIKHRIIDCLPRIATILGFRKKGLQLVEITVVRKNRKEFI